MAFFNVRSKMISILVSKPNLVISQHGIQPKGRFFLPGSSLCRSFSTDLFRSKFERIPYAGKFFFVSPEQHYLSDEEVFREKVNKYLKWGLVPSSDPKVKQVESIARKMIAAMNEGLMLDKAYKINGKVYEPPLEV